MTDSERAARAERASEAIVREHAGRWLVSSGMAFVLTPVRCGVDGCTSVAVEIDPFTPYHTEASRCRRCAPPSRGENTNSSTNHKE
jgi:hypothetical protein